MEFERSAADGANPADLSAQQALDRVVAVLESMGDAFLSLDSDWRVRFVNRKGEALLQRRREEIVGRDIWAEFPEAVGSRFQVEYERVLRDGVSVTFEEFFEPLGRWFEINASPADGGLSIFFRDVTEHHAARQWIQEQAALLDQARDAILTIDLSGRVGYWNRGAERLYGLPPDQAVGREVVELIHGGQRAEFETARAATLSEGQWVGSMKQFTTAGAELVVESRWTLVRKPDGTPSTILKINTDVTERRKLEQQFLRAQRLESIGTLAGGIAHDLNNVLAPIVMGAEVLRFKVQDANSQRLVETIATAALRGADMVKQVLAFARGVEGDRVRLDTVRLLAEVERIVRDTFPRDIDVVSQVPAGLPPLLGDATQVQQVLLNLCVNARDAMPGGGRLTLVAERLSVDRSYAQMSGMQREGVHVVIRVEDTGAGIPAEAIEKIFDPFFTTKDVGKGTGLGLSTALAIVKSHGGFINVYSEPGRGSRFKIYLPAADEVPAAAEAAEEEAPWGHGELVLVVDDEPAVLHVTEETLESFGYRVVTAVDGADAVARFAERRGQIAVVLTDMMMPVMDGAALVQVLRRIDPHVKVIGASGLGAGRTAEGLVEMLTKPYTASRLLTALRRAIDGPRAEA